MTIGAGRRPPTRGPCPAYDAAAVRAGMQAHLRALRRGTADLPRWATDATDDGWLARLLDDIDWGDEC